MARIRSSELAADRREDALDLIAEGDQNRDGHHRDEGQDESVLNQGLTLLAFETAQRSFGARNNFVDHFCIHLLSIKKSIKLRNWFCGQLTLPPLLPFRMPTANLTCKVFSLALLFRYRFLLNILLKG